MEGYALQDMVEFAKKVTIADGPVRQPQRSNSNSRTLAHGSFAPAAQACTFAVDCIRCYPALTTLRLIELNW